MTIAPPTGALVITSWADGTANDLRLKVVSTTDVIGGTEHRFIATEPAEVLEYVRRWFGDFGDAIVTAARRPPVSLVRQGLTEVGSNPRREGK